MIGVYTIYNKISNKYYVGSSINICDRKSKHFLTLKKNIHSNIRLQNSFNKYGIEAFEFEVLEECDKEFIRDFENFWMNMLNTNNPSFGYNIKNAYTKNFKLSEEARKKISISSSNRRHSEETRRKISLGNKGKVKIYKKPRTFIMSEEQKKKISSKRIEMYKNGYVRSNIFKKAIIMLDTDNNVLREFSSVKDCCTYLNKTKNSSSTIITVCKNKPSSFTAFGYKWKYKEEKI